MLKILILLIIGMNIFCRSEDLRMYEDIDQQERRQMVFNISSTSCKDIDRWINNDDPDYDYEDCQEQNNEDVVKHIGHEVRRCCGSHGFLTMATCPGNAPGKPEEDFLGVPVCLLHNEEEDRENMELHPVQTSFCPDHCTPVHIDERNGESLNKEMFVNDGNKTYFTSKQRKDPFCVDFFCKDSGSYTWNLKVIECNCDSALKINQKLVEKVPDLPLCCGPREYLTFNQQDSFMCEKDENDDEKDIRDLNLKEIRNPTCDWKHKKAFELVDLSKARLLNMYGIVCIGATQEKNSDLLSAKGVKCQEICNGKGHPCIRRCCEPGEIKENSICTPNEKNVTYFSKNNLNTEYIPVVQPTKNQELKDLYPGDKCEDIFQINKVDSSITLTDRGIKLEYGEYCIAEMDEKDGKGNLYLEVLLPYKKPSQNIYYSLQTSILFISIACLIATIIVYVALPALHNSYSKIMLNFSISMLCAFLSLTVIKKPEWFTSSTFLSYDSCKFVGYFNQFCFISMFTWMTIMSYEIFKQMREMRLLGVGKCSDVVKQMLVGYGIPGTITILAMIVDAADEGDIEKDCATLRPRFGKGFCSFQNRSAKFFWLLLPILVMLILNTFMFIYVILNICKAEAKRTQIGDSGERMQEKADRMLLYIKLFFGMGFVWYFEIIGFLADAGDSEFWWIPDTLNMLQGVWVFLTFVCKRNVLAVILKKRKQLYISLRRSTGGPAIELRNTVRKERLGTSAEAGCNNDSITNNEDQRSHAQGISRIR